jgi:BirA family biotin operon repressor/biotin-[acetyl-CoA-carboxylase] ligase
MARELAACIETRYRQLQANQTEVLLSDYNARLYKRGQAVRLRKGQMVFETIVQGVSIHGELLTKDTLERSFRFGEVEWII